MEYVSVNQYADAHGLPERTVRNWCAAGKIHGAFLTGKTWNIPADASIPERTKQKISPLLNRLREEKEAKLVCESRASDSSVCYSFFTAYPLWVCFSGLFFL